MSVVLRHDVHEAERLRSGRFSRREGTAAGAFASRVLELRRLSHAAVRCTPPDALILEQLTIILLPLAPPDHTHTIYSKLICTVSSDIFSKSHIRVKVHVQTRKTAKGELRESLVSTPTIRRARTCGARGRPLEGRVPPGIGGASC